MKQLGALHAKSECRKVECSSSLLHSATPVPKKIVASEPLTSTNLQAHITCFKLKNLLVSLHYIFMLKLNRKMKFCKLTKNFSL